MKNSIQILSLLITITFWICSQEIISTQAVVCYTDVCHSNGQNPSACPLSSDNNCTGEYCFLEYSSDRRFPRYQRGCMNDKYLHGEAEGCYALQHEGKKMFCQCRTSDFCNDLIRNVQHVSSSNVTCDTACRVTESTIVCTGRSYGPFCAYDPENRARPYADYGESYFTPYGMFAGWSRNTTVCVRFTFPPFYYIRDVACFCDSDFCDRATETPIRATDSYVLCKGCYLDCHEQGEFCGSTEEMCRPSSTCRGHYCVSHSVVDTVNQRLVFLGQYCLSTSRMLPRAVNSLTMDAGRYGRTEIRVCRTGDYCNDFDYSQLSAGPPPENNPPTMYLANTWERLVMLRKAIAALLNAIVSF